MGTLRIDEVTTCIRKKVRVHYKWRSNVTEIDTETKAIGEIAGIVGALDEGQRGRVIRYILERFNLTGTNIRVNASSNSHSRKTEDGDAIAPGSGAVSEFDDIASLMDACSPTTDSLKALVAGYWLQVCQGNQSFDGQSANKELKNLGHAVGNITRALGALMDQKPALVLQLRKSGNTKQARKMYKVTEAGIRKVKAMTTGVGEDE
jgi:hypothetical protein